MDGISQAGQQNVALAAQIFAMKKAMQSSQSVVLGLVQSAVESSAAITNNPPNLGQNVDVKA